MHRLPVVPVAIAAFSAVACSDSPTGPPYHPDITPAQLSTRVTNPYFPLVVGTTYTFRGQSEDGQEMVVVEVLNETKVVNGVTATVVRDRVYVGGNLVEDTHDWYAQDAAGNVWYLGEDSKEIENGRVVSTEGSWEWGRAGALPGIVMWADPAAHVGEAYRQEYYQGEAEDWGKVVALNQSVTVPFGNLTGCIKTEDWNALESGALENKFYCRSIGVALEMSARGGSERVELVSVTPR
jgi:hypothetical protein